MGWRDEPGGQKAQKGQQREAAWPALNGPAPSVGARDLLFIGLCCFVFFFMENSKHQSIHRFNFLSFSGMIIKEDSKKKNTTTTTKRSRRSHLWVSAMQSDNPAKPRTEEEQLRNHVNSIRQQAQSFLKAQRVGFGGL